MREIIKEIVKNSNIEARWLNTLSLLEFIGARKISKTVCEEHPSLEVLRHFADESYCAYIFKRLCWVVSDGQCKDYLCADEAMSYFQMMDQSLSEWLASTTGEEDVYATYLLVTMMVEKRALEMYSLYQSLTQNQLVRDELEKIIHDESSHRAGLKEKVEKYLKKYEIDDLSRPQKIEADFFDAFEKALKRELLNIGTSLTSTR